MKYKKLLIVAATVTAMATHSAQAGDIDLDDKQVQIAEDITRNVPAESRNVNALRLTKPDSQQPSAKNGPQKVQPAGAQALMALGLGLIVTPSMFGGAFSN